MVQAKRNGMSVSHLLRHGLIAYACGTVPAPAAIASEVAPQVSVFAGGNMGAGWWTLEIRSEGTLVVKVLGEQRMRRNLAAIEKARLAILLDGLPRRQSRYAYGFAVQDVDAYALDIPGHRYFVGVLQTDDACPAELAVVVRTLVFLRALFESERALDPGKAYAQCITTPSYEVAPPNDALEPTVGRQAVGAPARGSTRCWADYGDGGGRWRAR